MGRILLFNTDLELGGTPTVVRELARRLPADVACLGRFGPVAEQIAEQDEGHVTAFNLRPRNALTAVRRLRQLVAEREVEVVLSFLVHANVIAALARRKGDGVVGVVGVRWVQSIQTTQPTPRWHWRAQRWAAKRADAFIVPSASIREAAKLRSNIDLDRVAVIPNGVDITDIVLEPRPPRDPAGVLRVGFLGRLDPVKRVPLLVRAVRSLERVELHIFGDGPDRPSVEAAAEGMQNVKLHGLTDRVVALAAIDVLCLPSLAEGFPMVLVEAMAAGVPVIGADAPGIRDALNPQTGRIIEMPAGQEVASLAAALAEVRDDPASATHRAAAALQHVHNHLTWQHLVPRYREVLLGPANP